MQLWHGKAGRALGLAVCLAAACWLLAGCGQYGALELPAAPAASAQRP